MKDDKLSFINEKLNRQNPQHPQYLFKYRPFDKYTFDMLENDYLFLCAAVNLDDPSECKATLKIEDYYDIETNRVSIKFVDAILEYIRPYTSMESFERIQRLVYQTMTPNGYVRRNFLLDASFEMQELAPNADIVPIINFLGSIPEKMQEPEMVKQMEKLFFLAYDAREKMGICSLSELSNFQEMWDNYAKNSAGYCVEFDMTDYSQIFALYPVVYQDNRETDITVSIVNSLLGEMIFGFSNGQFLADRSSYLRLFLTKDTQWSYQKEWRLLGDAGQKIKAPKIKTIYIGKNASSDNQQKMREYCDKHNITLVVKE